MSICGGWSQPKEITDDVREHLNTLRNQVEIQKPYGQYDPISYRTQVVAGVNYRVRIRHDECKYYEVLYFCGLDGVLQLNQIYDIEDA